ncbi:MAG: murein biosynthesis integral membrane protein MurJ [SAR324 cluster bacterium]|nr:murein biosynthesis integral membrane protein MurJ [SAR324 cluster bacterium]
MNSTDTQTTRRQILRRAGVITLFTLISRILGAVRDLVIAHVFGAGLATDAFVQAFTIPNVFRRLTAEGSMTLAFIPLYTEIRETQGRDKAKIFARKVMGLVFWSTLGISLACIVFSPQLVYLFAAGFADTPEQFDLTVWMTRLMFPYLIMISLVAWAMGVLNAEKIFAAPAAAPILLNVAIIGFALGVAPLMEVPIIAVAWGVLVGGIAQVILQIPSLRSIKQSIRPIVFWNDPEVSRLLRLLGPSIFGIAVYQINIIILRNIASFLPSGQVTYYYNANRLTELVLGVFAVAFATATFPELSEHTAQTDWVKIRSTVKWTIKSILFIILPATAGLTAAAQPIVAMLYLHGAYSVSDVTQTATTLQAFAVGIPAIAVIRVQISLCYALKDTRTPVIISLFTMIITALLGWWWSKTHEVVGLALGLSVGTWFQSLSLWATLRREPELREGWLPMTAIFKYTLASCGIGALAWYASSFGNWDRGPFSLENWARFSGILVGAVVLYPALLIALRDTTTQEWLKWIKKKLRKNSV